MGHFLLLTPGMCGGGIVLLVAGEWMKPSACRALWWDEILREAVSKIPTAIGQVVSGPTTGDRSQGVGSLLK